MKTLLVTGGAGFIGANFVHYWLEKYPEAKVVVLDALTYAGNMANLVSVESNSNYTFFHGNICDQKLVEKILVEHKIDTLVHFAAESHVDRSITGPDAFIETNIMGTYSLLKAAKKVWLDGDKVLENHRFHLFLPMRFTVHYQQATLLLLKILPMHLILRILRVKPQVTI